MDGLTKCSHKQASDENFLFLNEFLMQLARIIVLRSLQKCITCTDRTYNTPTALKCFDDKFLTTLQTSLSPILFELLRTFYSKTYSSQSVTNFSCFPCMNLGRVKNIIQQSLQNLMRNSFLIDLQPPLFLTF